MFMKSYDHDVDRMAAVFAIAVLVIILVMTFGIGENDVR
jgi:hypothetical protein